MKKWTAVWIALLLLATAFAGCAAKDDNTLKVGMELAYPPFETKDDQGSPMGVSVEFANALGEYLDRPVEIQNIAWDGLIPALQTGKVDIVISSMTIKESRLEEIDFSKPYAKALLALLTNVNSGITVAEDLNQAGKKIAVKTGTTGDLYAHEHFPNAQIISLTDESACVTEVVQGKADAFIYDQLTIYRNQKANPDITAAVYIPGQEVEYWGVGIKKGNTELVNQVNAFIDGFYAENGFDAITQQFLADEKAAFDALGFDWFFDIAP